MDTTTMTRLSGLLDTEVKAVDVLRTNRSPRHVARLVLADGRTAIVKYLDDIPSDWPPAERDYALACLGNEALALRTLSTAAPGLAPGLLAVDAETPCVVLSDLGNGPTLAPLLLGDDPIAATTGLFQWSEALGRLHASCAGRLAELEAIRRGLPLPTRHGGFLGEIRRRWDRLAAGLSTIGIEAPDVCVGEVEAAARAIEDPRWRTLLHGDACPDNVAVNPMVLFDWETADVGHALLDAAYLWMPFPTCWCAGAIPEHVVTEAAARYRVAAAEGLPGVLDDSVFLPALDDAMVAWWLVSSSGGLSRSTETNPTWGISTHQHRLVHRATAILGRGERMAHRYPCLFDLADRLATAASSKWPDAAAGLALYPAFSSPQSTPD